MARKKSGVKKVRAVKPKKLQVQPGYFATFTLDEIRDTEGDILTSKGNQITISIQENVEVKAPCGDRFYMSRSDFQQIITGLNEELYSGKV